MVRSRRRRRRRHCLFRTQVIPHHLHSKGALDPNIDGERQDNKLLILVSTRIPSSDWGLVRSQILSPVFLRAPRGAVFSLPRARPSCEILSTIIHIVQQLTQIQSFIILPSLVLSPSSEYWVAQGSRVGPHTFRWKWVRRQSPLPSRRGWRETRVLLRHPGRLVVAVGDHISSKRQLGSLCESLGGVSSVIACAVLV